MNRPERLGLAAANTSVGRLGLDSPAGGQDKRAEDDLDFENFYLQNANKLWRFTYQLTRDRGLAEDATQEAFMAVVRNWSSVKSSRPYLYAVARHVAYKLIRDARRIDLSNDPPLDFADPDREVNPEKVVQASVIEDLLSVLTQKQRELMLLVLVGHTPSEAAEVLGLSPSTGRTHYARALRTMRDRAKGSLDAG